MKKRWFGILSLIVLCGLFTPILAQAASYNFYMPVRIYNNCTSAYYNLTVLVDMNNTELASWGYIDASGLDTAFDEGGTSRDYSLSPSKLPVFIPEIAGGQQRTYTYKMDYSPLRTNFPIMVGLDGYLTVGDDSTLELFDNFTIILVGHFDTYYNTTKNLVFKEDAFCLNMTADYNITADMTGNAGIWCSATGIDPGEHTVRITADGTDMSIYVDDNLGSTVALAGAKVTDNGNGWYFMMNESIAYLEEMYFWTD